MPDTKMRYWQFRAFDAAGVIKVGVTHGTDGPAVVLRLRQTGLQVFDLRSIDQAEYRRFLRTVRRLARLRASVVTAAPMPPSVRCRTGWLRTSWLVAGGAAIALICWLLSTVTRR